MLYFIQILDTQFGTAIVQAHSLPRTADQSLFNIDCEWFMWIKMDERMNLSQHKEIARFLDDGKRLDRLTLLPWVAYGAYVPPTECHHRGQCSQDCIVLTSPLCRTRDFSHWLWKLAPPMSASYQEFLTQIGRRLNEMTTDWPSRNHFLPARRYASADNSDRNVSVCPSVRPTRAGIVSKRRKLAAWFFTIW